MNFEVIGSMIIYTIATVAFYLLGAGILNKMGLVPEGKAMIATLTNIYTQTYGEWSKWLFYLGAIVIPFCTTRAPHPGHSTTAAHSVPLHTPSSHVAPNAVLHVAVRAPSGLL